MERDWSIPSAAKDWECDWEGSERFQLRYFKALPIESKLRAVENMCKTALFFQRKAAMRASRAAAVSSMRTEDER